MPTTVLRGPPWIFRPCDGPNICMRIEGDHIAYIAVAVNVSIDLQIFDLHQGGTYLPKIPYCCNQS